MGAVAMSKREPDHDRPLGRAEIVQAILASAAELFAAKGPSSTSLRDVATHAVVNHSLIHRYFGTKQQLLAATLQHLADRGVELAASGELDAERQELGDLHMRVLVRSALDGYPIAELQERRPGMEWVLDQARPNFPTERGAQLAAAHATALQYGWRLLGPVLRAGFGLADMDDEALRAEVIAEIGRTLSLPRD